MPVNIGAVFHSKLKRWGGVSQSKWTEKSFSPLAVWILCELVLHHEYKKNNGWCFIHVITCLFGYSIEPAVGFCWGRVPARKAYTISPFRALGSETKQAGIRQKGERLLTAFSHTLLRNWWPTMSSYFLAQCFSVSVLLMDRSGSFIYADTLDD